jgi:hypothetical protein
MYRRTWNSTLDREKLQTYHQLTNTLVDVVMQQSNDNFDDDMWWLMHGNDESDDAESNDNSVDGDDMSNDMSDNSSDDMSDNSSDVISDNSSDDSIDDWSDDSSDDSIDDWSDDSSDDSIDDSIDDSSDDSIDDSIDDLINALIDDDDSSTSMTDDDDSSTSMSDDDDNDNNNLDGNDEVSEDGNIDIDDIMVDDTDYTIQMLEITLKATINQHKRVYTQFEDKNIAFAGRHGHRKSINDFNESECLAYFRFKKEDLVTISHQLWPVISPHLGNNQMKIELMNSFKAPYETCLLAYLFKMARPQRLVNDMEKVFCLRKSHLSSIIITFGDALYEVSKLYLCDPSIWHSRMPYYAWLVHNRTEGLVDNVWGFIDATFRRTCRPYTLQHLMYSGYKKCHGLKYQTIATPDGFVACLHGPYVGRQHDASILTESRVVEMLQDLMPANQQNGPVYAVFGDMAYRQSLWVYRGFLNPLPGSAEARVNQVLSGSRASVEWAYGHVLQKFSSVDFKQSQQVFHQKVGQRYINCTFISNWSNCFYGTKTSQEFEAEVLSFEEYLNLVPRPE